MPNITLMLGKPIGFPFFYLQKRQTYYFRIKIIGKLIIYKKKGKPIIYKKKRQTYYLPLWIGQSNSQGFRRRIHVSYEEEDTCVI
jgi:hypothetical protein